MIQIDMEMPEKCGLCPLFHAEHPMHCQGVKADRKKKIVAPYGQPKPDWCPLHKVTADPDTVSMQSETTTEIQKILDYLDNELHLLVSPDNWNVYSELYDMVSELENLPPSPTVTSDPDTVSRQAEPQWIPLETVEPVYDIAGHRTWAKKYKCSNCGFIHTVIEDFGHYRHCPECGKRMDIGCENVPVVDMRGGAV